MYTYLSEKKAFSKKLPFSIENYIPFHTYLLNFKTYLTILIIMKLSKNYKLKIKIINHYKTIQKKKKDFWSSVTSKA